MSIEGKELHVALRRWGSVVMMKVLKTPKSFMYAPGMSMNGQPHKEFIAKNGIRIRSSGGPQLTISNVNSPKSGTNAIYLHGNTGTQQNCRIVTQLFTSEGNAKKALSIIDDALKDFMNRYTSETCAQDYAFDVPTEDKCDIKGKVV
jgi:hypothetical protein